LPDKGLINCLSSNDEIFVGKKDKIKAIPLFLALGNNNSKYDP
jgi:hypothetical protein